MNSWENYEKIISIKNLVEAWKKARKGKTRKKDILEFEKNLGMNLKQIFTALKEANYHPFVLQNFIIRDPKTRKISKSDFSDRIVHHALCNIIEPIFDKIFIYDSCANRKKKGNLFAIKRFEKFQRKVTRNLSSFAYCLKGDIKHYFQEVNREILLQIIKKEIKDKRTINLIRLILDNFEGSKGMPLGNLTSQFFANVYLNELDKFVKHELKAKYYIRYVDDFVILHKSEEQLQIWKKKIEYFLSEKLHLELHPDKSKIVFLSKGVDFVGFRIFYHYKLLRKRNRKAMKSKILKCEDEKKLIESFRGWKAYSKWANTFYLTNNFSRKINPNKG